MKHIVFPILFLSMSIILGQSNNFPTNGNVTINDGHLIQTGSSNYISTQGPIKLKNYLLFDSDGDFTGSNYYTIQDDPSGNFLRMGYGFSTHLTIGSTGNVGIGTSSPGAKLDVNGSMNGTEYITVSKGGSYRVGMNGQGHGYIVGRNDNVENKFQIHSNGTTWFNGGNVGIGTSNPQHMLTLNGGSFSIGDGGSGIPFKIWAGSSGITNHMRIGTDYGHYGDSALEIYQDYGGGNEQNPGKVIVNGNMGIGTTAPDSKLTVKGNIHAEEVKVDLSVPGPDYVFKEGYELRSLEEVQNYIKENGHLPNIPSAKEMEAKGIQLGKMNMKLLEKIEELTLYTLEQEEKLKRMAVLEKKITQMEKAMAELQKDKL